MTTEDEDNLRLRRAKDYLEHSREAEGQARRDLYAAEQQTRRAKTAYEKLFLACEARAVERRKSGHALTEEARRHD